MKEMFCCRIHRGMVWCARYDAAALLLYCDVCNHNNHTSIVYHCYEPARKYNGVL